MKVKKIIKKVIAASMSLALVHTTIAPIPVLQPKAINSSRKRQL